MKECPTCRRCFPDDVKNCPDDATATAPSIAGEPILDDRYQLEKRLGQGGMGVVFKARHIFLKTQHAIKIILPDLVGKDPNLVTRFRQEALAAAAIRHQNIIAVTDFGVVRETMPFLVMEFIQGKSLQDIMAEEGAMPPLRACELIQPVCAGIAAAHRQKIVHRDLKPLNVMIQEDVPISEGTKILDFGLAKIKSGDLLGSFVAAHTTGVMGSPFYMAPEQWSDDPPDARADIYSLGVMFYQMLCGEVPFTGSSIPSVMKKHLTMEAPSLASKGVEVPPQIEAVVRHALEKDPKYRTPSAEEFANELREAMTSDRATLQYTAIFGEIDPRKTISWATGTGPGTVPKKGSTPSFDPLAGTISAPSRLESFNLLTAFRRSRLTRTGAGLLVLAGAAFAQYKLIDVPRPVYLETTGKFSPATIRLGQAELIIEGAVVDSEEKMLFSHNGSSYKGRPNETLDVSFERARLGAETIERLYHPESIPPSTMTSIYYRAEDLESKSSARGEPCRTRVELFADSKMPDEIHIFQLGDPGANNYRYLEMKTKGAELVSVFSTESVDEIEPAPGCRYVLRVGDWKKPLTKVDVTTVMAENSDLRLYFRPLTPDSTPWDDTGGFLPLDLGTQRLERNAQAPFQARSVSIKSLDRDNPRSLLSAKSANGGPLLTIDDLKVGSGEIQVSVGGKGLVEINGEPWTPNFSNRILEHKLLAALLAAVNIALLALVARLIFKTRSRESV